MTGFSLVSSFDSSDLRGTWSLSKDGSTVAIGNSSSGVVKIYRINNCNLEQLGIDIYDEVEDGFGREISLSSDGSILAVGAPDSNNFAGYVRLYKYINDEWIQLGSDINGGSNYDYSGDSISLSSDGLTVAIGSTTFHPTRNGTPEREHVDIYKFINDPF